MAIRLRSNFQKYLGLLSAFDIHAAVRNGAVCVLLILTVALLFFGIESLIEQFVYKNDKVVDIITAIASTFLFFWVRSAIENVRLHKTLRKHSEERAQDLEVRVAEKTERIKQMYDAQSKFLTDIAHEFQTPISILKGNIALLAKTGHSNLTGRAERINALYVTNTTLDRLSRLVTNLLDIARLNFSKNKFDKQLIDVRALAEEAREDCAVLAEDKNISIMVASGSGDTAAPVFVAGDKDKLKEVLLNLLSNALKHTPAAGSISIMTRVDGEEAEIVVTDSGPGIAPENLPQIFERFYRIENRRPTEGMGIGLHICRQIIEAHSGTIVAESEPRNGSRFVIHLPSASCPLPSSVIINACQPQ